MLKNIVRCIKNSLFTSQIIVITALSGVAATLILGEMTHSALYLNHKTITPEHIESWQTVRLLIIDKISFADKIDFDKIDNNLRKLKQIKLNHLEVLILFF